MSQFKAMLKRLQSGLQPGGIVSGVKRMGPHYAQHFGVHALYALKSGKYRMFYTREGSVVTIIAFVSRSDKTIYTNEH